MRIDYSVFVEDVEDDDDLTSEAAEVDISNSADFNEVLVSLRKHEKRREGTINHEIDFIRLQ